MHLKRISIRSSFANKDDFREACLLSKSKWTYTGIGRYSEKSSSI